MHEFITLTQTALINWFEPLAGLAWGYATVLFCTSMFSFFLAFSGQKWAQLSGAVGIFLSVVVLTVPPSLYTPTGTLSFPGYFGIWLLGILCGVLFRGLYHWRPSRVVSFIE